MTVRWSPEVNLGAVIQSITVLGSMLAGTVVGTMYISSLSKDISLVQQRVATLETSARDKIADDKLFQNETRISFGRIRELLGNVRSDMNARRAHNGDDHNEP